MGFWKASTTGRPCSRYPAPTSSGGAPLSPPLPPPPPPRRNFSDSPAGTSLTPSKRQPGPLSCGCRGCVFLPASGLSDPEPHPPNPESHTHHQDVSTRAGSVSSSSSSKQARLRRAAAREPSGAAGLGAGAGTGARARRGGSCAASSAPPSFSIAPQDSRRAARRGVDAAPAGGTPAVLTHPPGGP